MSCNKPLKAYIYGINPVNHKNRLKVLSWSAYQQLEDDMRSKCIDLPCGKCIECRLAYSRQWADRLMVEAQNYPDDQKWFITLTYEKAPVVNYVDDETGEVFEYPTLVKKDAQNFIKRLRFNYQERVEKDNLARAPDHQEPVNHIKYYLCGEYGGRNGRPHYHLIVFGLPLPDIQELGKTHSGFNNYYSEFIDDTWKQGIISVCNVNWDTCAYVARYVMKKKYGEEAFVYKKYGIQPEFVTMSLKPAIGLEYFQQNYESMFKHDCFWISTPDGGRPVYPGRYFTDKYIALNSRNFVRIKRLKEKRAKYARSSTLAKLSQVMIEYGNTSDAIEEMLTMQECYKKDLVSNSLKRRL